ncbi:cytochrome b [Marinobacterium aestuariivivens]|uniref:Cytochrome b n=1 Tax=Marinobacterium aestuariivivens TaxID=1698799 RepID=A0ABW2A0X5_9GAMM
MSWFGLFTWPDLVEPDKALAGMTKTIHASLAGLLLLTLLLHVAGALRHHFWLRDDVLRRMLPGQARRAGRSKP